MVAVRRTAPAHSPDFVKLSPRACAHCEFKFRDCRLRNRLDGHDKALHVRAIERDISGGRPPSGQPLATLFAVPLSRSELLSIAPKRKG